jgi:hypothetical protein
LVTPERLLLYGVCRIISCPKTTDGGYPSKSPVLFSLHAATAKGTHRETTGSTNVPGASTSRTKRYITGTLHLLRATKQAAHRDGTRCIDVRTASLNRTSGGAASKIKLRSATSGNAACDVEALLNVRGEASKSLTTIPNIRLIALGLSPAHHPLEVWTSVLG